MNKAKKGFSLAELLISLLVVSIVLAAAIPTLTKRMASNREYIWNWSTQNNSAYFGMGSNQGAIIGYNSINNDDTSDNMAKGNNAIPGVGNGNSDDTNSNYISNGYETASISTGNYRTSSASKLAIYKKFISTDEDGNDYHFDNSHIVFFTIPSAGTTDGIEYAGRLAMDSDNIALGKGTLQSMSAGNIGENTAIGHLALLNNSVGIRNTAVGKKALASNVDGDYNTALGYASLLNLTKANDGSDDSSATFENTSVGALSLEKLILGSQNTAVGSQALRRSQYGVFNTAVGRSALINLGKNGGGYQQNTAIGSFACSNLTQGSNNICIGYHAGDSVLSSSGEYNYGLYIGGDDNEYPLISGHTAKATNTDSSGNSSTTDKELIVSSSKVEFKTDDGKNTSFKFDSNTDDNNDLTSSAVFNLSSSNTLTFEETDNDNAGITSSKSLEITTTGDNESLVLNDKLTIQNNSDTPTLTMSPNAGISLESSTNSSKFWFNDYGLYTENVQQIKLTGETVEFYNSSNSGILIDNDNNITLSSSNNITLSSAYTIQLGSTGNVKVYQNKLYINNGDSDMFIGNSSIRTYVENIARSVNNNWSDERLKNISGDSTAGLKEINALEVKNYTYKADKEKTPHVGVIAQQLQKIFPNSVFEGDDGYLRIRTEEIFYAMVNSIKELCTKIQDLTAKITGLDKRITELEEQNKLLTEQNKAFEKRLEKLEKKAAK